MNILSITDNFSVSGAIDLDSLKQLAKRGVTLLINVRPDKEAVDQITDEALEEVAALAGLRYVYIPVKSGEYPADKVTAFARVLHAEQGAVHGICRTGTRAAHLWALAQCKAGVSKSWLQQQLIQAGIDVIPIRIEVCSLSNTGRLFS